MYKIIIESANYKVHRVIGKFCNMAKPFCAGFCVLELIEACLYTLTATPLNER